MSMDNTMEQKGQHTPAPWVWEEYQGHKDDLLPIWRVEMSQGCGFLSWEGDAETINANARLIAAAPELLPIAGIVAALPIQADVADDVPLFGLDGAYITHGDVRNARAAIAKAKGTTE